MDAPRNPFDQPDPPSPDQPSSATGVFGQVQAAPRAEEDLLASLLRQAAPEKKVEASEPPKPAVVASPAQPTFPHATATVKEATPAGGPEASRSPGEFTRMLQALTTPETSSGAAGSNTVPKAPGVPSEGRTNEVARVFSPVAMERPRDQPTLGIPTPASKPVSPAPAPASNLSESRPGQPAQSAPGDFTRMFSNPLASSPHAPSTNAPSSTAPVAAPPSPAAPKSASGEFTKMFSSPVSSAPAPSTVTPTPTTQSEPGAFTKMFSSQGASMPPHEDPLKSLRQEPTVESGLHLSVPQPTSAQPQAPAAAGGFTQLLQALNQEPRQKEQAGLGTSSFGPMSASSASSLLPQAPPAPAAPAAAGGFTQLLQSLAQPGAPSASPAAAPPLAPATPSPFAAPAAAPPFAPAPPASASPWATPPSLPPSAAPPMASGPGEFTRVISGSALRDLQGGQGMPPAAPLPPAPAAGPAWTPPQMPKPPAMPQMPAMPPGMGAAPGMHVGMPPAGGGGMPFAPQAFGMPQAVPPAPMQAAPPQTTLQKYLPLILVLNVFLLLVIVLILFFVMHHK